MRAHGCGQNTRTCIYRCHTCVCTHPCLHVRPGGLCGYLFNWTDEKKKPPISNAACSMEALAKGLFLQSFAEIVWFCSNTAWTPCELSNGCRHPWHTLPSQPRPRAHGAQSPAPGSRVRLLQRLRSKPALNTPHQSSEGLSLAQSWHDLTGFTSTSCDLLKCS